MFIQNKDLQYIYLSSSLLHHFLLEFMQKIFLSSRNRKFQKSKQNLSFSIFSDSF